MTANPSVMAYIRHCSVQFIDVYDVITLLIGISGYGVSPTKQCGSRGSQCSLVQSRLKMFFDTVTVHNAHRRNIKAYHTH